MGPTTGIDTFALTLLLPHAVDSQRISIYLAEFEYRHDALHQKYENLQVNIKQPKGAVGTA
jgi:hypothetical protein